MMPLTYVELFAGAGGLSRGLEMAGWECVAHAEWDAHARAVLRRHWPDTPLFGDVSTLTGQMIYDASGKRPVTMLTGGSPCQDLSIAGKRAGMTEDSGTRSSLYFQQVRLWHELHAIAPCPYFLWENVLGAFSSNHGKDFAAVLSALVGTPVPVPEDGWKGGGGVVSGCTGVAAWRVLDCQFFGPPQRRRRVFVLGVRAGGVDPAEVLSLLDRLSGHPESGAEAGQNATRDAGASAASGGGNEPDGALTPWDSQSKRVHASTGVWPTLQSASNSGQQQPSVFSLELGNQGAGGNLGYGLPGEPIRTLSCEKAPGVVAFAQNASGELRVGEVAGTLGTNSNASGRSTPMISGVMPIDTRNATRTTQGDQAAHVLAFHATQDPISSAAVAPSLGATAQCGIASVPDARITIPIDTRNATRTTEADAQNRQGVGVGEDGDPSPTLTGLFVPAVFDARGNGDGNVVSTLPGDHLNRITDYTPVVMRQREGKAGGGKGPLVSDKDLSLTGQSDQVLFTQQALGEYADKGVASSIKERDHKDATDLVLVVAPTLSQGAHPGSYNGQSVAHPAHAIQQAQGSTVRPRRLMPIECERLMGWPDEWTASGTDEAGRLYQLSDSARYKLCGNGVASPVAGWIGWRLRVTLEGHA